MIYNILKNRDRGFTLLEMIVSLGIFSLVAVIAVGSLVRITGLNRRAQSLQSAMDNVGFALESMTRDMRYGTGYQCVSQTVIPNKESTSPAVCVAGRKGIIFMSAKTAVKSLSPLVLCPLIHAYWFDNENLGAGVFKWSIKKSEQATCGGEISLVTAVPIIDEKNITITEIDFDVKIPPLPNTNPNKYSLASFRIVGHAGAKDSEETHFDIRTAVSQRISD